jgi:probable phosphoglycerate mutase
LPDVATRYLYLARHGEALSDESGLSAAGRQQALLLGRRLRDRGIATVYHGPLPRATQTAHRVGEQLVGTPPLIELDAAGDFIPHMPTRDELPDDYADFLLRFLDGVTREEAARGRDLARQAIDRFTGPVAGDTDRHELLITHNFLIAWLVCHALGTLAWRWLGLNFGNAALTVIRYAPGRPASPLIYNDMDHLSPELRWSGFPRELRA